MSAVPLAMSTPGVAHLLDLDRARRSRSAGTFDALWLFADELDGALTHLRARLPTAVEMQWAMAGGRPWLFPWGDKLPRWMLADEFWIRDDVQAAREVFERKFREAFPSQSPPDEPAWARSNRFGVVDPLVMSCWCTIDDELAVAGGAAGCFPWQGCCEWAWFLCAAVAGYVPDADECAGMYGAGLRPVISLPSVR